jgi:hypothetical protein
VLAAFRDVLQEALFRGIGRFPTLALPCPNGTGLLLVGYRPYAALGAALARLMPGLRPQRSVADREAYVAYWGGPTPREMADLGDIGVAVQPDQRPGRGE